MKKVIAFHTDYTIEHCVEVLKSSIDEARFALLSWSGYADSKDVVGSVKGHAFRLQKRRYYRNDFAPYFYGRFLSQEGGTRIEGYFDFGRFTKIFWSIWMTVVILFAAIALIFWLSGETSIPSSDWWAALVLPGLIMFGIILPKFGRWLGRNEETFILEFLQRIFVGRIDRSSSTPSSAA